MTRLPEALRRKLERSAKAFERSMNAEIIHRLNQSYVREEAEKDIFKAVVDYVFSKLPQESLEKFAENVDMEGRKDALQRLIDKMALEQKEER
jgi:hypothetical protein